MAGVQLLTAQGQALETGQHLPEEARFREALVERQPHGPHADPDPHADLEQLQADRGVALFSWTPKIAWIGRGCSLERRGQGGPKR